MSHITDSPTSWRRHWVQAQFRTAIFYVESDSRASGRRVAVHQYPKRNEPYAEDMGRSAIQITVQGYCIGRQTLRREQGGIVGGGGFFRRGGEDQVVATQARQFTTIRDPGRIIAARDYLTMKNELITALEKDGPGMLRLPMQYQQKDLEVMVMGYTVTESRESGGMCRFQMQFCEYGNPRGRPTINTADEIRKSALTLDNMMMAAVEGKSREQLIEMMQAYTKVFNTEIPPILQTDVGRQRPGTPG